MRARSRGLLAEWTGGLTKQGNSSRTTAADAGAQKYFQDDTTL